MGIDIQRMLLHWAANSASATMASFVGMHTFDHFAIHCLLSLTSSPTTYCRPRHAKLFFVSCALVSSSLSVTGKKRRKTKRR